ncbi:restriction endonuclease [Rhodococcus sp. NPDC004095]
MTSYIADPHQAELNAERVMKSWGFIDAKATTGGADGGIDVRSSRALAQVKWKNGAAGRPEIQQLYGARGNDHEKQLFFFAASSYTKEAVTYADQVDVKLFIYDPLGAVEPANQRAKDFVPAEAGQPAKSTAAMPWLMWAAFVVAAALAIGMMLFAIDRLV